MKNSTGMIENRNRAFGCVSLARLARSTWLIPAVGALLAIAPLGFSARATLVPTVAECGGGTAGFWSNKNGLSLITIGDYRTLTFLPLVNSAGDDADFVSLDPRAPVDEKAVQKAFSTWLRKRNAENMASQLSGQLAAFTLNVNHFKWGRREIVGDSGRTSSQLLLLASQALAVEGGNFTVGPSPLRDYQELLKDVLDWANNEAEFRRCP